MTPTDWLRSVYPHARKSGLGFNLRTFCTTYKQDYLAMYRHVTGRIEAPRYEVMRLFYDASGGQVELKDWMDLYGHGSRKSANGRGRPAGQGQKPAASVERDRGVGQG